MSEAKIVAFNDHNIRRVNYKDEWWFVITDIVVMLTSSNDPSEYLKKIRKRDLELNKVWEQIAIALSIETPGGKQKLYCANTEGVFRIIQSIPSPKAEPFKRWLAKVGYERVQEIENPELASERARELYKTKGYSDNWIEKRLRGIQIRAELTDEWKQRDVGSEKEFAILTAEISKATFGITPSDYKQLKKLKGENLRDHMTDLELIFTMLGEASTTEIAREDDAQGFDENQLAARAGGEVAGNARMDLENRTGKKVSTKQNFLKQKKNLIEELL